MFHLLSQSRVKADLQIHVDFPSEGLLEAIQLFANVFFYHGKQRDFKVLQLGLQRGQLSSFLEERTDRTKVE